MESLVQVKGNFIQKFKSIFTEIWKKLERNAMQFREKLKNNQREM